MFEELRSLSDLTSRIKFAVKAGLGFDGARDYFARFGYKRVLTADDYRARFERDGMAARIVETMPKATWRGGGELIEDENPDNVTDFEKQWMEFAKRVNLWPTFQRADVLAGMGQFAVILIGAPGNVTTPLPNPLKLEDIKYLMPYGQDKTSIDPMDYETDFEDERFGMPKFYTLKASTAANWRATVDKKVHWSRIVHVADGLLDSNLFGEPRLQRIWNYLDDLLKLSGGGSEAFWIRANQGIQFDIDKEIPAKDADIEKLKEQAENYKHDIDRVLRTRGVKVNTLGSDVANFDRNTETVVQLISAATGIPFRILTGSERGELASTQDKNNWNERVSDRRLYFADPFVVRPFVARLVEHQALAEVDYEIRWPEIQDLDEMEKAALAGAIAKVNKDQGEIVVTSNEIRDRVWGWEPLSPEEMAIEDEDEEEVSVGNPDEEDEEDAAPRAASRKVVKINPWLKRKRRALSIVRQTVTSKRSVAR